MKKNLFLKLFALFILFIFFGCREEMDWKNQKLQNDRAEEFFKNRVENSRNVNSSLIFSTIRKLKNINYKTNFINNLSDKKGLPMWNYLVKTIEYKHNHENPLNKGEESSEDMLIIPLKKTGNYISSLMYVENPDSDSPKIYTITNEQLKTFVYDTNVEESLRERILMTFLYFDNTVFERSDYGEIPLDLFDTVPIKDGETSKSFNIVISSVENTSGLVGEICYTIHHCVGCENPNNCDGCHLCQTTNCVSLGGGVIDTGGNNGDGNPGNNGNGSEGGGGDGTGTGTENPENQDPCTDPNSPWYTHHSCGNTTPIAVVNLIQKVNSYGYNIADYMLFLTENPSVRIGFSNYLNANDNSDAAYFVKWGLQFLVQNQNITWGQFQNWFVDGGSTDMSEFLADLNNPNIVKPTKRLKNNTRINCIFNKAKNAPNFKQYLQNFDGRFSTAHLSIDLKPLSNNEANAETSPPNAYWINITINSNNLNRPSLDIARTFMHEMIHAEMFRILLSLASTSNGQIDVSQLTTMLNSHNYPGIYDYFRRFGLNNMQHQQMSAHYIGIMKNYLKQIDNSITNSQAEAMSWVGLQGTIAWDNLGATNQNTILNTYNSWRNNATHNCP